MRKRVAARSFGALFDVPGLPLVRSALRRHLTTVRNGRPGGRNGFSRVDADGARRWSRTASSQIRKQLDTVVSPKSKLTKPIRKPKATWVEPTFFADVEYRDITSEGPLRQSSFKGLKRK